MLQVREFSSQLAADADFAQLALTPEEASGLDALMQRWATSAACAAVGLSGLLSAVPAAELRAAVYSARTQFSI